MKKLLGISLVLSAVVGLLASEAVAGRGGGGSRGGGQQSARGRTGFSPSSYGYGYGTQTGAMQRQMQQQMRRQMMQNRYRWMQSGRGGQPGTMQQQRLRDGSCGGQTGYAAQGGTAQRRAVQGRGGSRRSGSTGRGTMQQQRLRDGSCGGQVPAVPTP